MIPAAPSGSTIRATDSHRNNARPPPSPAITIRLVMASEIITKAALLTQRHRATETKMPSLWLCASVSKRYHVKLLMIQADLTEGLTFDDVLLEPARSEVLPAEVDTRTCLTRNISLNIPIVSSAMDTVTESHLAIALAQQGRIGIVHRNMSIARQAEELDRVKRSESGMIVD